MTPDQVSQFTDAGYTIVPGFFAAAEVAAMKRAVDRWVAAGRPRDGEREHGEVVSFETELDMSRPEQTGPRGG